MHISTRGRYAVMAMVDLATCQAAAHQAAAYQAAACHTVTKAATCQAATRQPPTRQPPLGGVGEKTACGPVCLAEIAARQQLSLSYLEQLFSKLRRAGLVASARGPGGGYRLARPADAIAIAEVVLAVDEPIKATRCEMGSGGCMALDPAASAAHGTAGRPCQTHDLWWELGRQVTLFLNGITLADVVNCQVAGRAVPLPRHTGLAPADQFTDKSTGQSTGQSTDLSVCGPDARRVETRADQPVHTMVLGHHPCSGGAGENGPSADARGQSDPDPVRPALREVR